MAMKTKTLSKEKSEKPSKNPPSWPLGYYGGGYETMAFAAFPCPNPHEISVSSSWGFVMLDRPMSEYASPRVLYAPGIWRGASIRLEKLLLCVIKIPVWTEVSM